MVRPAKTPLSAPARRGRSRRARKAGMSPGSLVHLGERKAEQVRLSLIQYGPDGAEFREGCALKDCLAPRPQGQVTWINVDGLHEVDTIGALGKHFGIHPLVLEDLLNAEQRPKLEEHPDHLFLVVKMLAWEPKASVVASEQLSLIVGRDFVLTFQEQEGDLFDLVRQRIRDGQGRVRQAGPDYLAYRLVDVLVDHYFVILEQLDAQLEDLEDDILTDPGRDAVRRLHTVKREVLALRRSVWPMREVVAGLERTTSPLVQGETRPYVRDLYDHTIQAIDTVETFRDLLGGLMDLYVSTVSQRLNEVMKTLTIIATIVLPLTLIAGIYGMNFEGMPELRWRWGYPFALGLMAAVGGAFVVWFRRKGWL